MKKSEAAIRAVRDPLAKAQMDAIGAFAAKHAEETKAKAKLQPALHRPRARFPGFETGVGAFRSRFRAKQSGMPCLPRAA